MAHIIDMSMAHEHCFIDKWFSFYGPSIKCGNICQSFVNITFFYWIYLIKILKRNLSIFISYISSS